MDCFSSFSFLFFFAYCYYYLICLATLLIAAPASSPAPTNVFPHDSAPIEKKIRRLRLFHSFAHKRDEIIIIIIIKWKIRGKCTHPTTNWEIKEGKQIAEKTDWKESGEEPCVCTLFRFLEIQLIDFKIFWRSKVQKRKSLYRIITMERIRVQFTTISST